VLDDGGKPSLIVGMTKQKRGIPTTAIFLVSAVL